MKNYLLQPALILLALAVIAGTFYITPLVFDLLENVSYRAVIVFLIFIVASNILAKILRIYINL